MNMVEAAKERVLTRCRYSRLITVAITCNESSRMLRTDHFDKKFFERWLAHFELKHPCVTHGLAQKLLRIRIGMQSKFGAIAVVLEILHQWIAGQARDAAVEFYSYESPARPRLGLAQIAAQQRFAPVDETDFVAHLLRVIHSMG